MFLGGWELGGKLRGINKFKGDAHSCVCHSKRVLNMH